jgi:hypothetical protein
MNEGNIILLRYFNAIITNKQDIILTNISNLDPLWIEPKDNDLIFTYKRSFEDLIENLFGMELVKLCNCHDLIICNGLI